MSDELLTALNGLIWKVPVVVDGGALVKSSSGIPSQKLIGGADEVAQWWATELADMDIEVRWDVEREEFVRGND